MSVNRAAEVFDFIPGRTIIPLEVIVDAIHAQRQFLDGQTVLQRHIFKFNETAQILSHRPEVMIEHGSMGGKDNVRVQECQIVLEGSGF